jgi:hypothetical protein
VHISSYAIHHHPPGLLPLVGCILSTIFVRDFLRIRMIRSLLSASSLLFLAGLCFSRSQEQRPPLSSPVQGPSIRAESRIVVVDVVVTDKQGQSVPGLSKDDFHISEDSDPQIVTSFEEHKGAAANEMKLLPMPPNVFTNFPTTLGADSVNVLLLDLLRTPNRKTRPSSGSRSSNI